MCWGSFLNVVGYRLLHPKYFFSKRSICPHCKSTIAWYDLVPIISYIILRAQCRNCSKPISPLYPLIELITAAALTLAFFNIPLRYFVPAYFIWLSALIVNVRTDLDELLIPRLSSIALVPALWFFAGIGILPITLLDSIGASIACFGFFWLIGYIFNRATGYQGLGEGDYDLYALIGAGIGFIGAWFTLLIGSLLGVLCGIVYGLLVGRFNQLRLPFAPFLVSGAFIYLLFYQRLLPLLFRLCS